MAYHQKFTVSYQRMPHNSLEGTTEALRLLLQVTTQDCVLVCSLL
jgi:hypothetical protein